MKLVIQENKKFAVEDSNAPTPASDEVLFRVKACGICGSDVSRVFGGTSYFYPIVLGHEFSGIVEDCADRELIGKRACVFPILPCGSCEFCAKEMWASCVRYDYYGSRRDGGMQDRLTIKQKNLIFLPDSVSLEAAAMAEPCAVTLHAVKKARIERNSSVLIYGAGTIGLLCAMWARAFGAKELCVSDVNEARADFAMKLGFCTDPKKSGYDVILDASGAQAALHDAIRRAAPEGTVVLVGNASGDILLEKALYSQLLRKQLTLVGSWNSDFSKDKNDWQDSIDAIAEGRIQPELLITHKIPLREGTRAFELIGDKQEFFNKILVVT